jgi:hypothetical protein
MRLIELGVLFIPLFVLSPRWVFASDTLATCDEMTVYDPSLGMCEAYPMPDMPMKMIMVHGNIFGTHIWEEGSRAQDNWASTSMVMGDFGTSLGNHQYLNLDIMATAEKWTMPDNGYPLLLQIGETNSQGQPFIDAQHPHSSPIMGLTLSDTIAFGTPDSKNNLKVFFAPRGEATDGPIAFMHRITGMVNPDAPLGHHIGQDVGHITSTVIGGSLKIGATHFEASTYHGQEPDPEAVDLPIGKPDSFSFRLIEDFSESFSGMISFARVDSPEPDEPDILFETRSSASLYWRKPLGPDWIFYHTLIYGQISQYDQAQSLSSFTDEFLFQGPTPRIWGRVEVLQRTPSELEIPLENNPYSPQWVTAMTVGYTHQLASWPDSVELGVGGSVTKDLLPSDFLSAYGGNPWSGKIFLQLGGMKMWSI